jgi:hypothetical protein
MEDKMRKLNEIEIAIFNTLVKRGKVDEGVLNATLGSADKLLIDYKHIDNFTIAALMQEGQPGIVFGASKYNPKDKFDESIGDRVAFARALKQ